MKQSEQQSDAQSDDYRAGARQATKLGSNGWPLSNKLEITLSFMYVKNGVPLHVLIIGTTGVSGAVHVGQCAPLHPASQRSKHWR